MIDELRYTKYATGEHCIILYDKFQQTFAIHSKNEDNDVGIISGFGTAAAAIEFADTRVNALEVDSKSVVDTSYDSLIASEALFGFIGWMTTREEELTIGARHDAAEWAMLVDDYVTSNNLTNPRDGWENNLRTPNNHEN